MSAWYFGCSGNRAGHYWHGPKLSHGLESVGPWGHVDGKLTPGVRDGHGRLSYEAMSKEHQSEAALHHKDGWTALAIHDFTVDSRPNSNAVFLFDEMLDFFGACSAAEEAFPKTFKRITSNGERPITLSRLGDTEERTT